MARTNESNRLAMVVSALALIVSCVALYKSQAISTTGTVDHSISSAAVSVSDQQSSRSEDSSTPETVNPVIEPLSRDGQQALMTERRRDGAQKRTITYEDGQQVINIGEPMDVDPFGPELEGQLEIVNIGQFIPVDTTMGIKHASPDHGIDGEVGSDLPVVED